MLTERRPAIARPHIESIQAQLIPWNAAEGLRPGAEARILSKDDETGACSAMLRYPAGWSRSGPDVVLAEEELFVLDGGLTIGAQSYGLHDYACLPAGYPRHGMASAEGAVVLTFFNAAPELVPAVEHKTAYDEAVLIEKTSTLNMIWDRGPPPKETDSAEEMTHYEYGIKSLRKDPHTKESSFLFLASPQTFPPQWKGLQETHPVVEESFVVAGEMIGPKERRSEGAYFWRPPGILHGPYGSLKGCVSFIRTVGGPLVDEWNEPEATFSYDPEPQVVVPAEMEPYGTNHWKTGTCF